MVEVPILDWLHHPIFICTPSPTQTGRESVGECEVGRGGRIDLEEGEPVEKISPP